jgi:hypothetical protein
VWAGSATKRHKRGGRLGGDCCVCGTERATKLDEGLTYRLHFLQYLIRLRLGLHLCLLHLDHPIGICREPTPSASGPAAPNNIPTHSGDIFPLAGLISTLMSVRSDLLYSSFSAKAITAFPPLQTQHCNRNLGDESVGPWTVRGPTWSDRGG